MMNETVEFIARAERCLSEYDLAGATSAYRDAWECLEDPFGLDAARIRKGEANVALLRGEYDSAEEGYRETRERLAALAQSDPAVRTEVMRCAADEGQLNLQRGRLTSASVQLGEALDLQGSGEDADRVRLMLAELHNMRPEGREEATALIEDVKARWLGRPTPPDLAARLHEAQGLLFAALGEHGLALAEFEGVPEVLGTHRDALLRARSSQNRASVLLASGDPGQAGQLVTQALKFYNDRGFWGLGLSARTDEGMVKLALGDREGASKSFCLADSKHEETREFDPRERARNLDGWGNALQASGDLEDAAAKHRAALEYIDKAEQQEKEDGWQGEPWGRVDRARVLTHLATDHLLTYRLRYVRRAKRLIVEARDLLTGLPGTEVDSARCLANLGVVCALLGDLPEAEQCLEEASRCFGLNGRLLEQAATNHNWGCVIAQSADGDSGQLNKALDLLVPAALIRDSVRFALESSGQREQWWEAQATASVTECLRVARQTNDSKLITDLILVFRLPGPVSFSGGDDRPHTWFTALYSEPMVLGPDVLLKLTRGPRIRVPAGRVALEPYIDRAELEYHREVRTDSVAVIAGFLHASTPFR